MIERHLCDHVAHLHDQAEADRLRLEVERAELFADREAAVAAVEVATASEPIWKRLLRVETAERRTASDRLAALDRELEGLAERFTDSAIAEATASAERDGRDVVPERYRSSLSDDWFLYHGLVNDRGEIDHIILGPSGIWAIEVRADPVMLEVDGDRWRTRPLSLPGESSEAIPAVDDEGRSWGRQVAEPAAVLAERLVERDHPVRVRTAVVLLAERARIDRCADPGVDLVSADLAELDQAISSPDIVVDARAREEIDRIIVEHHRHHERLRRRRHKPRPSRR